MMKQQRITKKLTLFLVLFCCFFLLPFSGYKVARAAEAVEIVGNSLGVEVQNGIQNALTAASNALIANNSASEILKEFTLDPIAWNASKKLLNQFTGDVLKWTNSGFNGSPAFVTNLSEEYKKEAQKIAAEYTYSPKLNPICDTHEFDTRVVVDRAQRNTLNDTTVAPRCSLDQATGNKTKAFISDGNFGSGGYEAFFELLVGSNNDPIRAAQNATIDMHEQTGMSLENLREEFGWGGGFKSEKVCKNIDGANGQTVQRCDIVKPGAITRDTLAFTVGELPALQLLNADEFNEMVSGFMSNLTNQALTGLNGLLGLGGNSEYSNNIFGDGTQSYLDALKSDDSVAQSQSFIINPIKSSLVAETEYRVLQERIDTEVEELVAQIEEGESKAASCFDLTLTEELETEQENAIKNIAVSEATEEILKILDIQFDATTDPAHQTVIYQQFLQIQQQGVLRTKYDNTQLQATFIELDFAEMVDDFQILIDNEFSSCDITNSLRPGDDDDTIATSTNPTVPQNFIATSTNATEIELSWDASTNDDSVNGYQLRRDGTHLATTSATAHVDTDLTASSTHTYTIRAFDDDFNFSDFATSTATTTEST